MRERGEIPMNESALTSRRRLFLAGGLLVALAVVLVALLLGSRRSQVQAELQVRQAALTAGPRVTIAVAGRSPAQRSVVLSGEARPFAEVTLYAKVSGYLREIRVDKGDRVDRGQVLALIESPELDRQYDAAAADARTKRLFADRERLLIKDGVVARQDYDNAEAAARSAEATAEGLKSQKGYETVRAPFSGTVTARFVDPGALLQSATTNQTAAQPVATISKTDRLRVYVYLDQKNAAFVRKGDRAVIADAARPEVKLPASVTRISGELDLKSRTLLVELDLDNREGAILAGGFVQVSLALTAPPHVQVPAEALLVKGEQSYVGVVGSDNRVRFREVSVADSDGKMVRSGAGLKEGERVVLNPGSGISEGQMVQPAEAGRK
ncbi:efflux RND transporter periplasmic adaptor subunit [Oryzomonas japonica]|uniref:Efflux RND transporter periplasmic adaptor subunit n=2 Tax=Oryzomonas japonica TaxID=2603858 RepID=A0A7J4ZVZ0_9BACT|nr:efflux RND transporter periplasmic adaptor subunit [Oryzomonas japonica]